MRQFGLILTIKIVNTSEMDNGIRVVKNYSVGDIAAFIESQFTVAPTLQAVTEEGANTTVQMQINGVDVATVNDITGTPTLQEVVSEGNTVSGSTIKVELGSYYTSLEGVSANVSSSSNLLSLYAGSVLFEKQFGTGSVELKFPNTIDGTRVVEFPNASGIIALTNDIPTPAYKVYTALLTQAGTSAPIANVLESTLDGTVTFEYVGPGLYNAVLVGEFTPGSTTATLSGGTSSQIFKAYGFSNDRVGLVTYDTSGSPANNQMGITTLEIRVY